jgi:hypothetical protein
MTKIEAEWIKTKMGIVEDCVKDNAKMWAVPNKAIAGILQHCKIVRDYCQETQNVETARELARVLETNRPG